MMVEARVLSRRDLYDLVWSTPLVQLAEQFGVSDVGLKKICERHRIPTPPRGYWAKKAAGKKVRQALFAKAIDPDLDSIAIRPGMSALPDSVREVVERQRAQRTVAPTPARRRISVEPVQEVHTTIKATAKALRGHKPSEASVRAFGDGCCGVEVGTASVERAIAILDSLARALDARGMPLIATGAAMEVQVGPDKAIFGLKERSRTVKHEPTASELAEHARRQRQLELHWQDPARWARPPYGSAYPETDTVWTGELVIEVEGYSDGVRRKWADGKTQTVEGLVPSIAEGLEVLIAARKSARQAREEQSRQWAELERRRGLARARKEREEARTRLLDALKVLATEAVQIKIWLEQVEREPLPPGTHLGRMIAWTKSHLTEIEARLAPGGIELQLERDSLFPEPGADLLHDPLGDPEPIRWW